MQEEQHNQDNEQDGLNQRFDHILDRGIEEVVGGHHLRYFHSLGRLFLHLGEQRIDIIVDFRSVGACGLEYHTLYARVSVLTAVVGVTLFAQLNVGNVTQTKHFAVGGGADNDVAELFGGLQTPFVLHGVLVRLV